MLRCAWWRQPIEKTAALTSPPQRKARPVSIHAERGSLRRGLSRLAVANGMRSFSTGHSVSPKSSASASPLVAGLLPLGG